MQNDFICLTFEFRIATKSSFMARLSAQVGQWEATVPPPLDAPVPLPIPRSEIEDRRQETVEQKLAFAVRTGVASSTRPGSFFLARIYTISAAVKLQRTT